MATLNDLRDAIAAVFDLPSTGATLQLNNATRERAFEAYVLALLMRAVRHAGGTAIMAGINSGDNPSNVVLRGAPGRIGSKVPDFAFAKCNFPNKSFEIHLDVQYEGLSHAIHEVDVSIYTSSAAQRARVNQNEFAKSKGLEGAFECKFYDSQLGTALGRTFVGLLADFRGPRLRAFCTNGSSPGLAKYFQPAGRPNPFFRLSPLNPDLESVFVRYFEQEFRKWAGIY